MTNSTSANVPVKTDLHIEYTDTDPSGVWVEPPLRAPVPSFEDYKGLERHGVLEHMAPLGSLPPSKVKARVKQHDAPRRAAHLRNGEMKVAKQANNADTVVSSTAQPPEPRGPDGSNKTTTSPRENGEMRVLTQPRKEPLSLTPIKGAVVPSKATNGTPLRTPQGLPKLEEVVDAAVDRANHLGDPVLGDAVKEIYQESLYKDSVADLLNAVLTQKATSAQTADFQSRIRAARKRHKERIAAQERAQQAVSNSAIAKSSRSNVSRYSDDTKVLPTPPSPVKHNQTINNKMTNHAVTSQDTRDSPVKEERPPKRVKRSNSISSDSSLSSLDSIVEDFPPTLEASRTINNNHPSVPQVAQARARSSNGPRLGHFPIRPDSATRRPLVHLNSPKPHQYPEDAISRKREQMRQRCASVIETQTIQHSAVRASPSPIHRPHSPSKIVPPAVQSQQRRLRASPNPRSPHDDSDSLDSPVSSSFGEFLVPPSVGASRGATPNQLGRQPKVHKKAARIKLS